MQMELMDAPDESLSMDYVGLPGLETLECCLLEYRWQTQHHSPSAIQKRYGNVISLPRPDLPGESSRLEPDRAASMSHSSELSVDDGARFRVNAAWSHAFVPEWFVPAYWGEDARPVDAGGRGGAWFVTAPAGDLVLRFYQRGGFMARLSRDAYVRTGRDRSRAFAEFDMLQRMSERGLPVPEPVAAGFWPRAGVFYRAAILVERLAAAQPLPSILEAITGENWEAVGATLRWFHDEGIDHADLNAFNILWVNGSVYVIDFDKGQQRARGITGARWQRGNLDRLHRSLLKLDWSGSRLELPSAWSHLLEGYAGGVDHP